MDSNKELMVLFDVIELQPFMNRLGNDLPSVRNDEGETIPVEAVAPTPFRQRFLPLRG